jgi:hypothetical protein
MSGSLFLVFLSFSSIAEASEWSWWQSADCATVCPPARMGFNHIRVADHLADDPSVHEVERIGGVAEDLAELGAGVVRHMEGRDASWWATYDFEAGGTLTRPESYRFDGYLNADDGIGGNDGGSERLVDKLSPEGVTPIMTLFQMGHTSGARLVESWADRVGGSEAAELEDLADEIRGSSDLMGPHAEVLFDGGNGYRSGQIIEAYAAAAVGAHIDDDVRLFEAGNEPYFDAMSDDLGEPDPERYAKVLHHTRVGMDSVDPDTFLVLGGLADFETDRIEFLGGFFPWSVHYDTVDDWLVPVVEAEQSMFGQTSADIISFHYYGLWQDFPDEIDRIQLAMADLGIDHLPLWLTEVGCPQDDGYWRPCTTNDEVQAAEIVRLMSLAYGSGVDMALWHTHLSKSSDCEASQWNCYGVLNSNGTPKRSWYTYQLLSETIGNFGRARMLSEGEDDAWVVTFSGALDTSEAEMEHTWVLWTEEGEESLYDLQSASSRWDSDCLAEVTNTVPTADGTFTTWFANPAELGLSPEPALVTEICREDGEHRFCSAFAEIQAGIASEEGDCVEDLSAPMSCKDYGWLAYEVCLDPLSFMDL